VNFEWPWSFFALRCGWMAVMNLAFEAIFQDSEIFFLTY
jgi:hypothetical protein